jgi:hypothetical protein
LAGCVSVGHDLNCGIGGRRRFKDKAAVLLRTVHRINQHTPIELLRDLSGPMIRWLLELGMKGEKNESDEIARAGRNGD